MKEVKLTSKNFDEEVLKNMLTGVDHVGLWGLFLKKSLKVKKLD